jgi:hypothetical protein
MSWDNISVSVQRDMSTPNGKKIMKLRTKMKTLLAQVRVGDIFSSPTIITFQIYQKS